MLVFLVKDTKYSLVNIDKKIFWPKALSHKLCDVSEICRYLRNYFKILFHIKYDEKNITYAKPFSLKSK